MYRTYHSVSRFQELGQVEGKTNAALLEEWTNFDGTVSFLGYTRLIHGPSRSRSRARSNKPKERSPSASGRSKSHAAGEMGSIPEDGGGAAEKKAAVAAAAAGAAGAAGGAGAAGAGGSAAPAADKSAGGGGARGPDPAAPADAKTSMGVPEAVSESGQAG